MKKIFVLAAVACLVMLFALPTSAAELSGGYSFTCDCALGDDITFYVPASYAQGCLTYNESGYLFNISSSTIYLYCPDYPDYTFSASRFAIFQYRTSSDYGTSYQALNIRNVTTSNVEIFSDDPSLLHELDVLTVFLVLCDVGTFAVVFLLLLKWGDKHV